MFSLRLARWRRERKRSFPPRPSAGGSAPIVFAIIVSAVFCTSDDHERQTRDARARSCASRKENQWIFASTGIHVLDTPPPPAAPPQGMGGESEDCISPGV